MIVTINFLDVLGVAMIMFFIGMIIWGAHIE